MADRLLLLDRDGTLVVHVPYLHDPEQVELLPGVLQALRRFKAAGWKTAMVTNQSGVGRGYFPEERVREVNARLQELLEDCPLDLMLYCPHGPDHGCECRKPLTGMGLKAAEELQVELKNAVMVGDSDCDLELARALGIPGYRVGPDRSLLDVAGELLGEGVSAPSCQS